MTPKYILFLLLIIFLFNGSIGTNSLPDKTLKEANIKVDLTLVADKILAPVSMTNAGDGSNRLFICEQPGIIKIIKNNKVLDMPFLDIRSKVIPLNPFYDERGLLGLAFHPQYKINGRFFIYYTANPDSKEWNHKSILAE